MKVIHHDQVEHVGTEAWMERAAELLCFRPPGGDPGSKATTDDFLACPYEPGHDGDCVFGNAAHLESIIAAKAGIRP